MSYTLIVEGKIIETTGGNHDVYSNEQIVFNANGPITQTGVEKGLSYNDPKDPPVIKALTTPIPAKAIVMFRPLSNWQGEFGFDWMRTGSGTNLGQTSILGDVDYKTILGHYNNNLSSNPFIEDTLDANHNGVKDLYEALKKEYKIYPITSKLDSAGQPVEYLAPILSMYKNENESAKSIAVLQLQIEVEGSEPEDLVIEYERAYFEITKNSSTPPLLATESATSTKEEKPEEKMKQLKITKTVTSGTFNTFDIQIECKACFGTVKEINAYTITANPDPAKTDKIKTLAGVLRVMPNDKTKRKVKNIVLVNVKTDVDNIPITKEEGFVTDNITLEGQKVMIRKILRQALIDPIFTIETLDLSSIGATNTIERDNFNHKYVVGGKLKCYYVHEATTIPTGWKSLSDYLFDKLVAVKGNRYNNYMRVFYVAQSGYYIDKNNQIAPNPAVGNLGGYTDGANPKNIVMTKDASPTSSAHEVLHSLKLPHTWESKNHLEAGTSSNTAAQAKHSLKFKSTNNIMDYGEFNKQYFLYYWQCIVANNSASAEPPNYTPVP
jgi:type VI secretion system secreted protein VgrG